VGYTLVILYCDTEQLYSYLVMASGFYFSPQDNDRDETIIGTVPLALKAAEPYMHVVKTFAYSLFTH
jgi:hypothetical protein